LWGGGGGGGGRGSTIFFILGFLSSTLTSTMGTLGCSATRWDFWLCDLGLCRAFLRLNLSNFKVKWGQSRLDFQSLGVRKRPVFLVICAAFPECGGSCGADEWEMENTGLDLVRLDALRTRNLVMVEDNQFKS